MTGILIFFSQKHVLTQAFYSAYFDEDTDSLYLHIKSLNIRKFVQ